jgi:hypothetical protein
VEGVGGDIGGIGRGDGGGGLEGSYFLALWYESKPLSDREYLTNLAPL